ncbi:MAG TPA: TraR/DksA family transcriptional regulator [Pirellulales bacterium]|nr:TraR/DksA family transcriptional regulator [Pirellulales bacterium]
MDAAKLEGFRERLLAMRRRLVGEFSHLVDTMPDHASATGDVSAAPTHLGDMDSEGLDAEIEVLQTEEGIINAVDDAIRRTEDGTFGTCQNCSRAISSARLDAIPYAPLCIDCARTAQ